MRVVLRLIVGALLRVRIEGRERIPAGPYVMVFNHPSWIDPFLIAPFWPGPDRLYILGPKELDMRAGWRNRVIAWGERGVELKPGGIDARDVARRVTAVLGAGHVLAVSGEGRLSDREGEVVPFVEGAAFFSLRDRVQVLPVGIVGTRWVWWGKTVRLIAGEPIQPPAERASRAALEAYTGVLQDAVAALIAGRTDGRQPGRVWRTFSELFNDRPWLDAPPAEGAAGSESPSVSAARPAEAAPPTRGAAATCGRRP